MKLGIAKNFQDNESEKYMSAYDFICEYFPGWEVLGDAITENGHGKIIIRDGDAKLCVHLNMNDASDWKDSDVTVSYFEEA